MTSFSLGLSFDLHLNNAKISYLSHDHAKYISQYLHGIEPRVFN